MNWLAELSVTEQVSALFVALFGLLLLVTTVEQLVSIRERDTEGAERHALFKRDLGALWIGSVVFWLAWISGPAGATVTVGIFSFLALREFITLAHTKRGDHRSLILAFFVVLPLQYVIVAWRSFDLFTVFIPVYVFLAIPVVSALAGDPERFLERNAKIQWGIMVCVYGLSHVPALLLLHFPSFAGRMAFLVFFLVLVVQTCMVTQHLVARKKQWTPAAPQISQSFTWRSWGWGMAAGSLLGALLAGITPFVPGQAFGMAFIACAAGSLGHLVMKALKRDRGIPIWRGQGTAVTGAGGLLDRVDALCFAAPVFFHSVRWYFGL
jgi:phosphatidate cytidylyltransferase